MSIFLNVYNTKVYRNLNELKTGKFVVPPSPAFFFNVINMVVVNVLGSPHLKVVNSESLRPLVLIHLKMATSLPVFSPRWLQYRTM